MSHAGDGGIDEGRPVEPDAAAVRAQLERVLQDPAFKASDRSRAFLRFFGPTPPYFDRAWQLDDIEDAFAALRLSPALGWLFVRVGRGRWRS